MSVNSAWNGAAFLLDASRPFEGFDPLHTPCPSRNPCTLTGATGGISLAGSFALSSNQMDIAALYDLLAEIDRSAEVARERAHAHARRRGDAPAQRGQVVRA